jgi:oligosaccharide repeat unit polymerase
VIRGILFNSNQRFAILFIITIYVLLGTFYFYSDVNKYVVFFLGFISLIVNGNDYRTPTVAALSSWMVVYSFLFLPISSFYREIGELTHFLISVPILLPAVFVYFTKSARLKQISSEITIRFSWIIIFCIIGLFLFFANVAYSGFVPLLSGIFTGSTRYTEYGIKGVNGLFYAFANAFALLAYYNFLVDKRKLYLIIVIVIAFIFALCVTRQNLISLVVELFIMRSFIRPPVKLGRTFVIAILIVFLFGWFGELRTGSIKELVGIYPEYYWVPEAFIWVYAYGFFNILNLDRLVESGYYGYFNGSSFERLIPSFLRPDIDMQSEGLELINFTISSYINPVFKDLSFGGFLIFSFIIFSITYYRYKRAVETRTFYTISLYAVLYFCLLFSFFVNFWVYLPIIFQIPFLYLFKRTAIVEEINTSHF